MLPHEYLDGLYVLRRQEQADILESIGRVAQKESALTAGRVADHIRQRQEESWPLLEAIDSEIDRMTGYCSSFRYKFWLECHSLRGFIWMTVIMTTLCFCLWAPIDAYGQGGALSGPDIFIGVLAVLFYIWAIWSSVIPDYQPKA